MSAIVQLPADAWTQIAPAGFGSITIQPLGNVAVLFEHAAVAPGAGVTDVGVSYSKSEPVTVGTDVATNALYARPAQAGVASGVRLF